MLYARGRRRTDGTDGRTEDDDDGRTGRTDGRDGRTEGEEEQDDEFDVDIVRDSFPS